MDLRKLKKLIDLVQESGISELEVTEGEEKVRIAKHFGGAAAPATYVAHVPAAAPCRTDARSRSRARRCRTARRQRRQVADGRHLLPRLGTRRQADG